MNNNTDLAIAMRKHIIRQTFVAGVGHTGGALSMVEILISIYDYYSANYDQDVLPKVVISKGHAAACLYAWLVEKGYLDIKELDKYRRLGSLTQSHVKPPSKMSPGINGFFPSGSLTHGLSIASGLAISELLDHPDNPKPVFCIMGDTEMQGGQIWETAIQISFHKLNHIIAIIDDNGMGNDYATKDTLDVGDLYGRFSSCGWQVIEVSEGNNVEKITESLITKKDNMPLLIIAKTIKGKGVSFMEGDNIWHGRGPDEKQFLQAADELKMDSKEIKNIIKIRDLSHHSRPNIFPREKTLRDSAADVLMDRMKLDERIIVIAPELAESTRAAKLGREFPDRVFNLGVQEPNAMDIVAGLSFAGKIPVIITFTNFVLLRTVDQIFQNIAPFCSNALIIGTHDGLLEDGMSVTPYNHFAIARSFYGSNVFCPADYYESKGLTNAALDKGGYHFIFNSRDSVPVLFNDTTSHSIGVSKIYDPSKDKWTDRGNNNWQDFISSEINVFVAGAPYVWLAKQAVNEIYSKLGINISLVNSSSIKPIDKITVESAVQKKSRLVIIEKHTPFGGLYSAIVEFLMDTNLNNIKISHFPQNEWVGQSGTPDELIMHYGFDVDSLKNFIISTID
jgi:transketolase